MKNRYQYATISNSITFPSAALQMAALAASTEALDTYWRAERELAKPGCRPATVHRQVLEADRNARAWARVAAAAQ